MISRYPNSALKGSRNQPLSFSVKIPGKRTIIRQKLGKPGFNGAVVLSLIGFQIFGKIGYPIQKITHCFSRSPP